MRGRCGRFILAILVLGSFVTAGWAQSPGENGPLTLRDLHNLLRRSVGRDMTEGDLAAQVERFGIAFDPTPEVINRLRAAGAHPHLINAVKRAGERLLAIHQAAPDRLIEEVRENVLNYVENLPDFICQQEITRYVDFGTGAWQKADTLRYELSYNHKRESYKPINTIGLPPTPPIEQSGGAYSTGDFATTLALLFAPGTKATFKPAGTDKLGSRQTFVYDFRVPQATSKMQVKADPAPPIIVGYSGSVWIDAETKQVLRIEQAADDLPPDYPATQVESSTDFDIVRLRGLEADFLLPVRAEFIIGDRRQRRFSRNLIYFKFYRKFETDIKIVDVPDPSKP